MTLYLQETAFIETAPQSVCVSLTDASQKKCDERICVFVYLFFYCALRREVHEWQNGFDEMSFGNGDRFAVCMLC